MAVKEKVINLLENNRGKFLSGEDIATQLEVTRAAVWKSIKVLQNEGYEIIAVTNKGYTLADSVDILSEAGIKKYLSDDLELVLEVYKSVSSTNKLMRERVNEKEGLVIATLEQTSGMGRLGRSFHSPDSTGIYFSILLKPDMESVEAPLLTCMAAVSVCEALEKVLEVEPKIKWVNDVFLNDKKISGILTQASFSLENNKAEYVIVGIGVNIYEPSGGFPEDIASIAGAVLEKQVGEIKNKVMAEILNVFMKYYKSFSSKKFVSEYKSRSFVLGKEIKVVKGDDVREAMAIDMDDKCHLLVEYKDGEREYLTSGEISIRL